MALGVQLPGVTSNGAKVRRLKTDGPGTLRSFDFKHPLTFPGSILSPTTSIPSGALLSDLPDMSQTPSHPATALGAAMVASTGGGIKLASGAWAAAGNCLQLPSDFVIPALSGLDGHYLIILGYKPGTIAANGGTPSAIAGFGTTNGQPGNNWCLYRDANNANTFARFGGAFTNLGILSVAPHRIALEMIKSAAAGTVTINGYVDGRFVYGSSVAQTALIVPGSGTPALGACAWGANQDTLAEYDGITIRNLALDTMVVSDIITADVAAWGSGYYS